VTDRIASVQPKENAIERIRSAERIFLAYSHSDLRRARDIHSRLVKMRRPKPADSVFLDQLSLAPGEDVSPAVIDQRLSESSLMVVLCGEDTPQRAEVQRELELGCQLRERGSISILPVILKAGIRLPALINYRIQAIQLTALFPEILWIRITTAASLVIAVTIAAVFGVRSYEDRLLSERLGFGATVQRSVEQVDQELSLANSNRTAERALLLARNAYNLMGKAGPGYAAQVELALRKALAPVPPLQFLFQDASRELADMAISPDGSKIAAGFGNRVLLIAVGPSSRAAPLTLEMDGAVTSIRFSADGNLLAAGNRMGQFCVWTVSDFGTQQQPAIAACRSRGSEREIKAVEFDPNNAVLITATEISGHGGEIEIWNLGAGGALAGQASFISTAASPTAIAVGKDNVVFIAGDDKGLLRWSWKHPQDGVKTLKAESRIVALAIRSDGKRIAGLSAGRDLVLWRTASAEEGVVADTEVDAFAYEPTGQFLVTAKNGGLEFHDADFAFDLLASRAVPCSGGVRKTEMSRSGSVLGIGCKDTVFTWLIPGVANLKDGPGKQTIAGAANVLQFHPDDPHLLLAGKEDGTVGVWDLRGPSFKLLDRSGCTGSLANQLVTMGSSALDRQIAGLQWEGTNQVWVAQRNGEIWSADLRSNQGRCESTFLGAPACHWAMSADGAWNAAITQVAGAPLLSVRPGGKSESGVALDSGVGPVRCTGGIAFRPKTHDLFGGVGIKLKSWSPDQNDAGKWNASDVQTFDWTLSSVAFDREGKWLAAGGGTGRVNGFVWIWNTDASPAEGQLFRLPDSSVQSLAFGGKERLAASLSDDSVRVWNLRDLSEPAGVFNGVTARLVNEWNPVAGLQKVRGLSRMLGPIMFTPRDVDDITRQDRQGYSAPAFTSGGNFFALSAGGHIQVLDTDVAKLAERACEILPDNLSWREWNQYSRLGQPYQLTCQQRPVHPSVIAEADRMAEEGKDEAALSMYDRIASLQQDKHFAPQERLAAWKLRQRTVDNIKPEQTRLVKALAAFREFEAAELRAGIDRAIPPLSFRDQLRLCRWSALLGEAKGAVAACDSAVKLLPADGMALDSRAIARALTGDFSGAKSDFEKSRDWLSDAEWKNQRRSWIDALGNGRNPISADVIRRIVKDELAK
jgi:WD40 repeat protein